MMIRINKKWTDKGITVLKDLLQDHTHKEIIEILKREYDTEVSEYVIIYAKKKYGLKSGANKGCFKKGQIPWNKGLHYMPKDGGGRFQKGHLPKNYRTVGSERTDSKDGYVYVKIADPNVWVLKHHLIWEQANGKIPKDHVILFKDNDPKNCSLDNLMLIEQKYMGPMSRLKLHKYTGELKETAVNIAKISSALSEAKKK